MKPLVIYKSSAGSGKTYALTKEYLTLALSRDHYYKHILAVTFTNKATRELKERVIKTLHGFSRGIKDSMFAEIIHRLNTTEEELIERSGRLLGELLNHYTRFSITTIDAFFQKIIRTFARDAGVQGNFKLETDENGILDDAVSMLIKEAGSSKTLSSWLVEFAGSKLEEGKTWDISREIKELGKELFTEKFKELESFFFKTGFKQDELLQFLKKVTPIIYTFESTMKSLGTRGLEIMHSNRVDPEDFKFGKGGVGSYFKKLANGDVVPLSKRGEKILEGTDQWYIESSPKIDQLIQAVEGGLMTLLQECNVYYEENLRHYLSAKEVSRYFYTYGIITNLLECLARVKSANDTMLISDSSSFLASVIEGHDAPFIYEKAGSWYHHYLIDEFQDTSGLQWKNFYPLIENSISQGYKNAIVGDVKQAIYRWRGSNWNLLQNEVQNIIGEDSIQFETLSENYRSDPAIIHFNNIFFATASQVLAEAFIFNTETKTGEHIKMIQEEASVLSKAYEDCRQNIPPVENREKGHIKVEELSTDSSDGLSWREESLERLPRLIEELQDKGTRPSDIAILVRKSSEGALIANKLLEYSKSEKARSDITYDIISNDILKLRSSNIITCLVTLLRWINDPEDELSACTFIHFYREYYSPDSVEQTDGGFVRSNSFNIREELPGEISTLVKEYKRYHLYELVEEIIRILQLNNFSNEFPFLFAFQDMVINFAAKESGDLSFFLKWWDETGINKPIQISGEQDAINILTIHKAKGLQFKVVVIPFCDWPLDHPPGLNNFIWGVSNEKPFDNLPFYPLKYGKTLIETYFAKQYLNEKSSIYLDNLNLLYVAFTRAVSGLFIFLPESGKQTINNVSSLVSSVLEGKDEFNKRDMGYEYGEPFSQRHVDLEVSDSRLDYSKVISVGWHKRIKISSKELIRLNDTIEEKIKKGDVIHELLARVRSIEDVDNLLLIMENEGKIHLSDISYYKERISEVFNQPQVKQWHQEAVEIKKECTLISSHGTVKRPDWAIVTDSSLIIVDFKTGIHEKRHIDQVQEYMQIARNMNHKNIEGYLVYLFPFKVLKIGLP